VGVLIEVPVMLAVAKIVNRSRAWYEHKPGIPSYAECCRPQPCRPRVDVTSAPGSATHQTPDSAPFLNR